MVRDNFNLSLDRRLLTFQAKEIVTKSANQTKELGKKFASKLKAGDIIFLKGELGSGKTTFVQGIAGGLGVKGFVRSSSFILINEHITKSNTKLYHIDCYRLQDVENIELENLGFDEYLYNDGICVIEWPEILEKSHIKPTYEIMFSK